MGRPDPAEAPAPQAVAPGTRTAPRGDRVGVVGLGAMGAPIARHLARDPARGAGPVVCYDLDPQRVAAAVRDGCAGSASLAALARDCAVVFVVVPTDADVRAVCLGPDALVTLMPAGGVLVVCSSVLPFTVQEVARRATAAGRPAVLDAALTGGVRGAEEGRVTLLVGGDARALDRIRPVLAPWCASVHHLGPVGAGQVAKSANNLVHWAQICAIEEALDLGRRYGLPVPALRRALMAGPADSRTLRELERMRLTWWAKDLGAISELGRRAGRELPVAAMCAGRMPAVSVRLLHDLIDGQEE